MEGGGVAKGKPLLLVGTESFMRSECNQVVLHGEISPGATFSIVFAYPPRLSILFSSEIISVERRERDWRRGWGRRTGRLIVEYRGLEELEW